MYFSKGAKAFYIRAVTKVIINKNGETDIKENSVHIMTAFENVALTSKLPPLPVLKRLGLTRKEAKRNVLKLSGGQQRRAAVVHALASDAGSILAEETIGNLDKDTAAQITKILKECGRQMNVCNNCNAF